MSNIAAANLSTLLAADKVHYTVRFELYSVMKEVANDNDE
jgi:hypothetical protein